VSGRQGALTIQGLRLVVPNGCTGVYSNGNGNPLTVRGLRIDRAAPTASIQGIFLEDEFDGPGPFTIEQNVIPSVGGAGIGIWVDGDTANAITASVKGNTVGSAGSPTGSGIQVTDVPPASSVTVERNRVDGGNNTNSIVGIVVRDSNDVIVQRNTVRNFVGTPAAQNAFGIEIVESPNTEVRRNVIANNDTGVRVDDNATLGTQTANTVVINDNNITSTVTGATGLLFIPDSGVATPAPLDATNNWWGAADGPRDIDGDANACPEAAGPTCGTTQPGAPDGTGLPVDSGAGVGTADCGTGPRRVKTCPFRTAPVSPAGA
jgi:nitrous oxidase accessory protein NosD